MPELMYGSKDESPTLILESLLGSVSSTPATYFSSKSVNHSSAIASVTTMSQSMYRTFSTVDGNIEGINSRAYELMAIVSGT